MVSRFRLDSTPPPHASPTHRGVWPLCRAAPHARADRFPSRPPRRVGSEIRPQPTLSSNETLNPVLSCSRRSTTGLMGGSVVSPNCHGRHQASICFGGCGWGGGELGSPVTVTIELCISSPDASTPKALISCRCARWTISIRVWGTGRSSLRSCPRSGVPGAPWASDGTVQLSHPQTLTTGRIATSLACWLGSANPRCHCNQPADHEDGTAIPLSRPDRPSRVQAADASSIREDVSRNLETNYQHRQPFILSFTPPVTLYNGRQGSFRRCRHGGDRRRCPPRRGASELR